MVLRALSGRKEVPDISEQEDRHRWKHDGRQASVRSGGVLTPRADVGPESEPQGLVAILEPTSAASEAYRRLRNSIYYLRVSNPPKIVVLTSPGPGEGKGATCANLGLMLAQVGKSTLLVDCDFRKPTLHALFGLRPAFGIGDVLLGERELREVWTEPFAGLKLAPTGPIPRRSTAILAPRSFVGFYASVRKEFDYVLVNGPPVGDSLDASILATRADGVLLVWDARKKTRKDALRRATDALDAGGANLLEAFAWDADHGPLLRPPPALRSPTKPGQTQGLEQKTHRARRATKKHAGVMEFLIIVVVSFVLVFGVMRPFVVEPFYIPTESMVPTLEVGDRILVNKVIYRFGEPERGDIIVFEDPDGQKDLLIKRVVGVPGDTMQGVNGSLFVNGERQNEAYVNDELPDESSFGPTPVPAGDVFVMGDNRADSADSRVLGPVPEEYVVGKAFLRVWPLSQLGTL